MNITIGIYGVLYSLITLVFLMVSLLMQYLMRRYHKLEGIQSLSHFASTWGFYIFFLTGFLNFLYALEFFDGFGGRAYFELITIVDCLIALVGIYGLTVFYEFHILSTRKLLNFHAKVIQSWINIKMRFRRLFLWIIHVCFRVPRARIRNRRSDRIVKKVYELHSQH